MSIESLKQQARRHEQNEEWRKALDQYQRALTELSADDQTDIGLINRVGDLYVRVGNLDDAVEHYERAVDLYREAFLPNNAIAVCKKIIRNVPDRHQAYLKIGQIRAEQGFLPDARTHFLTYAERMQQAGDLDESFRALVEFCDLAPDDVDVRITVADQMAANDRTEEAVEQLTVAYSHLRQSGESDLADGVEKKILELDPDAELGPAMAMHDGGMGSALGGDGEIDAQFGDIDLGGDPDTGGFGDTAEAEFDRVFAGAQETGEADSDVADRDVGEVAESLEEAAEEEAVELPTMDFGDEDEAEEEAVELPTMDFGDEGEAEEEAVELPTMDFGDEDEAATDLAMGTQEPEPEETSVEAGPDDGVQDFGALPVEEDASGEGAEPLEVEAAPGAIGDQPADAEHTEAIEDAVEEAAADAAAARTEEAEPEGSEPEPSVEGPAADGDEYVDLGAMILGGTEKKSTRFRVAYEEPSGDEEADFAKMLSQFKDKVSENLDTGDVRAHYDLGTAYKEMGLLEEAISSFQAALRASADHLPTYELMGQTFIEMGQAEAAVRALKRALEVKAGVEDEFVGIYYYLARAYEALDERDSAVEYYDRVFALDINFADVTERLRELR